MALPDINELRRARSWCSLSCAGNTFMHHDDPLRHPWVALSDAGDYATVLRIMAASNGYLAKAQENLASATSDLTQGRSNSAARSAYYACFHAAIVALRHAGIALPAADRVWGHDQVHALFVRHLIQRQKRYPAAFRRTLPDLLTFRHKADYRESRVSQREAQQAVQRAQAFVQAVRAQVAPGGDGG